LQGIIPFQIVKQQGVESVEVIVTRFVQNPIRILKNPVRTSVNPIRTFGNPVRIFETPPRILGKKDGLTRVKPSFAGQWAG
jgi:hypothetical protein